MAVLQAKVLTQEERADACAGACDAFARILELTFTTATSEV